MEILSLWIVEFNRGLLIVKNKSQMNFEENRSCRKCERKRLNVDMGGERER